MSKRILTGIVVGKKCDKTVKVSVFNMVYHKVYKKVMKKCKTYIVHDEINKYKCGDTVTIREHMPISAMKRWTVVN
ncbi:30S ribosomal protein S17 [Neoehrlichia mikurensis]|uniref:30S ribosomal protein S17 n=1 Tax=Neoehrlichia mikurensis TaxID=89586 RepID=A0A9Q9BSH1_9RICK|nr:30S ribosomal protein S17 [Neoehrlichia mikurensis]QXK91799.1 30S ribosomal protein S17 [Neoehrlichia mikurensis]QXK93012.1 30S ribosomal protein S17 [Neoehrlichia mikurensis]QXK93490.1 30S ribosomal protein S17 [Neoehrlichia mikurensis]UTO55555.1 30S ribosomal protein S17 [Neoehrlichia mikurensis]UTO56476.1 30S ribosomal protein S17 [Neoehrlichia mikurensis]